MFDMRCEEEAVAQPHSKARHEKLQNIHNQLKEDETRWQDVSIQRVQCWQALRPASWAKTGQPAKSALALKCFK